MTELGHLLTAHEVYLALGLGQEVRSSLYVGAIAPDAHRATVGVDYRGLHFRSTKTAGRRFVDFLRQYLRPALSGSDHYAQAFYTGWLCHICADFVWRQHLRVELGSLWSRVVDGPDLERDALRDEFHEECDWIDARLCERRPHEIEDIRWMLQHAGATYTVPPLQAADITRWRQYVLLELMPPPEPELDTTHFCTERLVEKCIEDATREALTVLELETKRARAAAVPSAEA